MDETFVHEGVIYRDLGNGEVEVVGYAGQQGGGVTIQPGNPYAAPKAQAELARAQADAARAQAEAPYAAAKIQAELAKARADAEKAARDAGSLGLTAETRAKLQQGYDSLPNLRRGIDELRAMYGSAIRDGGVDRWPVTVGLGAIPTDENRSFDDSGNRLSAFVASALGLSGQQFNTPAEAARFVDPYLPKAGDTNQQIEKKLAALEAILENGASTAEAQLGIGRSAALRPKAPDEAPPSIGIGPISPPGTTPPPPGMDRTPRLVAPPGSDPGALEIPTGRMTTQDNPALAGVNQRISSMLKSGAPDAQIVEYFKAVGLNPAQHGLPGLLEWRRQNPGYKGDFNVNVDDIDVPMSGAQQLFNQVGSGPVGAGFISAADAVTAGNLDSFTGKPEVTRAIMSGVQAKNPTASMAGAIAGGALAAGGLEAGLAGAAARFAPRLLKAAPLAADAMFGGAYGAGSADDGDRWSGALGGALAGAGGGMFGRHVARGAGKAFTGVRNEAVQILRDRNIPLTFGQALSQSGRLGAAVKGVEDRIEGLPWVGDILKERRREGVSAFNRSVFDEALKPIGQSTAGNIGEEGIEQAQDLVSDAYGNALNGRRVELDPLFAESEGVARQLGQRIPGLEKQYDFTYQQRVAPNINPAEAVATDELMATFPYMTGRGFQASLRGLDKDARAFAMDPRGYDFAESLGLTRNALEAAAERSAPDMATDLRAANAAYRGLSTVEDAVLKGGNTEGMFTPAQLGAASVANTRRFGGKRAAAAGNRPFFDVQRAAQQVLPSKVPDSGTAGRLVLPGMLALGGAGGGYAGGDVQTGALSGAALAALLTRPGQRGLVAALTRRPDLAVRIGNEIQKRARYGGMFGAGLGASLTLPPTR